MLSLLSLALATIAHFTEIPSREARWEALCNLNRVLKHNNITGCFISSGVLLGLYRDGQLLQRDDDIDFTCPTNMQMKITTVVDYPAWKAIKRFAPGWVVKFSMDRLLPGNPVLVDIYFYNVTEQGYLLDIAQCNYWQLDTVLPIKWSRFKGVDLPIPHNTGRYLADYYGEDWRTPRPGWKGGHNRPVKFKQYDPFTEKCPAGGLHP